MKGDKMDKELTTFLYCEVCDTDHPENICNYDKHVKKVYQTIHIRNSLDFLGLTKDSGGA